MLSLGRLRAIRARGSGQRARSPSKPACTLQQVQQAAADAGLLFPLSLASEGSCTIGGNLSTNAGGTAVLRYGNTRDLVLGVEVVLADGASGTALRGLRKDNTGYDCKQLFIGSEGTLGIITAAVLKLFAAAADARDRARGGARRVGNAVELLRATKRALGDRWSGSSSSADLRCVCRASTIRRCPTRFRTTTGTCCCRSMTARRTHRLQRRSKTRSRRRSRPGMVVDATIAQSQEQADRLWALRENISEAQRRDGPNIKHDISLPISAIPGFVDDAAVRCSPRFRTRGSSYSATSATATCTTTSRAPAGVAAETFLGNTPAVNRIVHDRVVAAGGSISAEHGIEG